MKGIMKIGFFGTLLTTLLLCNAACSKDDSAPAPHLEASFNTSEAMYWNTLGRFVVVDASGDWTVEVDYPGEGPDWCTPAVQEGSGDMNMWINTTQNESLDDRQAVITFTSGTMTSTLNLTQKGRQTNSLAAVIRGASTRASLNYTATTVTVDINVSPSQPTLPWTVSVTPAAPVWCTPSATSGTGNGTLTFDVSRNDGRTQRVDTILISSTLGTARLIVEQRSLRLELPKVVEPAWLLEYPGVDFAIEYNTSKKIAKWTAWQLDKTYMGDNERADKFIFDPRTIPYNPVYGGTGKPNDYRAQVDYSVTPNGTITYQRGHLCPSADRTARQSMNDSTFFYTNMAPQIPNLNTGMWKSIETREREWALEADCQALYICAGGSLIETDGNPKPIYGLTVPSSMAIPHYYFKVILRKKTSGAYDAIGFWIENKNWGQDAFKNNVNVVLKNIDEIEALSGIDFFYDLDAATQTSVEAQQPIKANWTGLPN